MSGIRKADITILLKKRGKKTAKLEMFYAIQWDEKIYARNNAKKYRLRTGGKWFPKGKVQYFTKWEVRDLLWRSFKF